MATTTTNYGLTKPEYTDTADIADINGNMDKVDAALGGLGAGIAIVSNNNTHAAITSGQYVYVHGHSTLTEGLYVATANVAANGTLSSSNMTAAGGALNTLNSNLTNVTNKTSNIFYATLSSATPLTFDFPDGYGIVLLISMWQGHGGNIFAARVNNNALSVKSLFTGQDYTGSTPAFNYNTSTHILTVSQSSSARSYVTYIQALI